MQFKGKCRAEFRSDARFAFHRDGTVHHIHNILGDGHPQPGSLNPADGAVLLPFEGFENMLHKRLAHADAVILDHKLIIGIALRRSRLFRDPHADDTACPRIFHAVA